MPGRRETPPGDRHFQPAPIANVSAAFAGGTRWAGNQFYLCLAKGHSCPGGAAAVRPRAVGAVLVSKSTPGPYCPNVRMSTILLGSSACRDPACSGLRFWFHSIRSLLCGNAGQFRRPWVTRSPRCREECPSFLSAQSQMACLPWIRTLLLAQGSQWLLVGHLEGGDRN